MSKGLSDSNWSDRITSGDRGALSEAFERIRPRLQGWVSVRLGRKIRATLSIDEVLQETFTAALRTISSFRGQNEEALLRWLRAIAENFIRKAAAWQQRAPDLLLMRDTPGSGSSPSHALRKEERFGHLEASVRALTPDQRKALWLVRLEGLKIKDAATRMGKTSGAVKLLLFRALRELRRSLSPTDSLHLPDRRLNIEDCPDDH